MVIFDIGDYSVITAFWEEKNTNKNTSLDKDVMSL